MSTTTKNTKKINKDKIAMICEIIKNNQYKASEECKTFVFKNFLQINEKFDEYPEYEITSEYFRIQKIFNIAHVFSIFNESSWINTKHIEFAFESLFSITINNNTIIENCDEIISEYPTEITI